MKGQLLAILQILEEDRVLCQRPGCNKTVYRKVHVIQIDDDIKVIGETCFKKYYKGIIDDTPAYTSGDGKKLTDEEREILKANTEALVAMLKAKWEADQAIRAKKEETRKTEAQALQKEQARAEATEAEERARREKERERSRETEEKREIMRATLIRFSLPEVEGVIDPADLAVAMERIRKHFREELGLDPDHPSNVGRVLHKARRLVVEERGLL